MSKPKLNRRKVLKTLATYAGRGELAKSPLRPRPGKPVVVAPRPGRNDPCPCGSGKKYKQCCRG